MLKQIKLALLLSLFLAIFAQADFIKLKQNEISEFEKLELFKRANIKVEKGFDTGTFYLLSISVQGNKDEVFLTKDKKYIISGSVIESSSGKPLKAPADLSSLKGKEVFTYGNGKEELILFTDPECPYCKKFESYFPQLKDKVKIKVFFYPLDFHPKAREISKYILSKKTEKEKIDAFFEFDIGSDLSKVDNAKYSKTEEERLNKLLNEQIDLGIKLGVQGTPSLYDKNGQNVIWIQLLDKYGIKLD
ncbi:DsbC family protein [Aliarcobacter thereius]|uniref:Disulfide isomerase/thiol-disulfide oxidase n=1 Tax=Aliarcobacter thereius LMG 24486 TaxID=1032240 RepID=A0A1C7WS94_9BACT|nr:DsbC family protein [Aliarcobacter thereius]OCL95687.1 disulfide isomerase/thiol-disulfide oxidase [Aliarcobacter thereius LMG 24486]QBF16328.1 thiol:disulfide interchange protein [Aliarcobacter thereius LMG 24486]TLS91614.1 DsbC family protein [Aliarcobacter thereius]